MRSAAGAKAVGWGGGALRTHSPAPNPRTQPQRNVAGRSGGRGTPETTPPGAGQGWRPAGDGGAEGRAGRRRRAAFPTRPLLCSRPLIPCHRKGHWARQPARGAQPSRRLSLPTFPSRAARLEERLRSRAGRGEARPPLRSRNPPR